MGKVIHKHIFRGMFNQLDESDRELVTGMMASFHLKGNSLRNPDGSIGRVDMMPGELQDVLAYALTLGKGKC